MRVSSCSWASRQTATPLPAQPCLSPPTEAAHAGQCSPRRAQSRSRQACTLACSRLAGHECTYVFTSQSLASCQWASRSVTLVPGARRGCTEGSRIGTVSVEHTGLDRRVCTRPNSERQIRQARQQPERTSANGRPSCRRESASIRKHVERAHERHAADPVASNVVSTEHMRNEPSSTRSCEFGKRACSNCSRRGATW